MIRDHPRKTSRKGPEAGRLEALGHWLTEAKSQHPGSSLAGHKAYPRLSLFGAVLVLVSYFSCALSSQAAGMYYVRSGAAGLGNGSDWNNAFTSLPATLERGATYYVAGGNYPSYTFNTPQSEATVVTVKKASPTDHGTDSGWVAFYGASQAVFTSEINIETGYFVLDGQYRNEGNWFDGDAYGFKIQNAGEWQHLVIRDPNGAVPVPNVTIKYLYIAAMVGQLPPSGQGYRPYAIDTETLSSTIRNVNYVFSRVYVDGSNNPFFVRTLTSPMVEYCASWRTSGSASFHGEVINRFFSETGGGIIRYNHIRDAYNGASGFPAGGGTAAIVLSEASGAQVYGNLIENFYCGDGAIGAAWNNSNLKVHNNTFINGGANTPTIRFPAPESGKTGVGNEAYNNLTVNCALVAYTGIGTFGSNRTENASIFINYAAKDYRLARHTAAGVVLPAPFNIDLVGNSRGADGVWDVGAYQYGNLNTNPMVSISPTALAFGPVLTNASRELVLTVQNRGGGTLSGSAYVDTPFSVISGGSYSLGANQSQIITIRYKPVSAGSNSQAVVLTGGGGAIATVSGVSGQ